MSSDGWTTPMHAGDWVGRTEKRLNALERRDGSVGTIVDIIGPGQNSRAALIGDWNQPMASNNGYFWSRAGALHAPDGVRVWTGSVVARTDNSGMQQVWNTDDLDDVLYFMRTFTDDGTGQGRTFSDWRNFATPTGFIELPNFGETVTDLLAEMAADIDDAAEALLFYEQDAEPVPGVSGVPPTIPVGSVWVDTDDHRHTYSWDGTAWVSVESTLFADIDAELALQQAAIEAAAAAADDAMDFAVALTKVYRQASPPSNPDSDGRALVGDDVWFDSDDDNRMYTWTGSWTLLGISTEDYAADAATAAQAAAIAAAAIDATTKAGAAQAAAISTAAGDATTKAAAAQAAAIAAAASDATTKANAAQAAAIAAAAADATTKAGAAQSAAIAAAAADATTKAAAAQAAAIAVANTKNVVFRTGTTPTSLAAGDVWFDTGHDNAIYRAFAAGVSTIGSSAWVLTQIGTSAIAPDSITSALIVANTIQTGDLVATAIDGMTVTGATLQTVVTASRGIKINSTGLTAYNGSGVATLAIVGATGAITMLGDLTSGSTITGATVTGGTLQSEATAARGVKITSGGLTAYNSSGVAQVTIDATTGAITLAGAMSGAGTITGPTFQTSASATTGIKINSTALVAYNVSNTATFTITAATGAIAMTGPVLTGGDITGATVTGGTLQSEVTAARGVKITSGGLVGYNSSGVAQFTLDATTGAVTLAGSITGAGTITGPTFQTSASANTGIKISSSGLFGYNGTTAKFSLNASTGILTLDGGVFTAGSIDGAIVTGGTLQTEVTTGRGIKMNSAGMILYAASPTAASTPIFTLNAATGAVTLDGSIAAMTISGAVVTGGTLQTTATASRGIKITSSGLIAYADGSGADPAGTTMATLLGTTGVLTLAGGVLTGGSLTGGIVTGGTLQSEATTGRGIKMNSSGLVMYAPSPTAASTPTFTLDATTGSVALAGNMTGAGTITGPIFQTASSGERIVVRNDGSGGIIESYSGVAGENPGVIDPSSIGGRPTMTIYPGWSVTYPDRPYIVMNSFEGTPSGTTSILRLSAKRILIQPESPTAGVAQGVTIGAYSTDTHLITGDLSIAGHATFAGTGWVNFSFSATWSNFGSTFQTAQYKRVGNTVMLRGVVKSSAPTTGSGITVLPTGFRVATNKDRMFAVVGNNGFARVDVQSSGGVFFSFGNATFLSLDGITFDID